MPEIIVASTTDNQSDIDHAAGIIPEPKEVTEGEEPKTESASEAAEPEKKVESKSAVQKRIDKLTREKHEARKEAEELKAKLLEAQNGGKPHAEEKSKEEASDPEPKEEDFQDYKLFVKAVARWEIRQELREKEAKEAEKSAKKSEADAANAVVTKYNERVAEAKERYDDWDDVTDKAAEIPEQVAFAIIELENGPDVVYYLGKHADTRKKLWNMSLRSAIAEVGKISQALIPPEVEGEEEKEEELPAPKITTRAKAPVRPVAGSSTKSSLPLDELPYSDFRKIRDKQEKERYRR